MNEKFHSQSTEHQSQSFKESSEERVPNDFQEQRKSAVPSLLENEALEKDIDWFREKYGVEIEFGEKEKLEEKEGFLYKPASLKRKTELLSSIKKEITKLPRKLIEKIGLKKIVIWGYIENEKEELAGTIKIYKGEMNIAWDFCFFHELFHSIDFQTGGHYKKVVSLEEMGERAKTIKKNREWSELTGVYDHKYVQLYDEEQSDYFAYLMNLDKGGEWYLENLTYVNKRNKVHYKKVREMKQLIYEWSDGLLDWEFWRDMEKGAVGENY